MTKLKRISSIQKRIEGKMVRDYLKTHPKRVVKPVIKESAFLGLSKTTTECSQYVWGFSIN